MKSNIYPIVLMLTSTMMAASASNWIAIWVGMEINLLAFIPLIKNKSMETSSSMMNYFLAQSLGSMILLFTVLINSLIMLPPNMINEMINIAMITSILIKLGCPPFHFWLPKTMNSMNWDSCMWLMTWQKLAPMTAMFQLTEKSSITTTVALLATTWGSLGGINQTSLRMMMGYSSMTHMGWMITLSTISSNWLMYLIIYSSTVLVLCFQFKKMNALYINQLTTVNKPNKTIMLINMMSMGGLPPFLGFLPKWMTIQSCIQSNEIMQILIMSLLSLMTLFFYLKMVMAPMLSSSIIQKQMKNRSSFTMMFIVNLTLPLMIILI
uniref:NADH-ubiquinone oxidoreductase chain 2 n=1 Tax=Aneurus similis TaxID=1176472 RepID=A0A172DYS2_9HEMI|nr:NADH dehydrogenase subunit 2 [Aneurus similis]AFI54669.1 NADH dehydrogenase subunit 2 [Aneurus similis]